MRRRTRKRKGPPQLQFVTATDPSDFKNEEAKRSVRSQAMIQYRYQSAEEKRHQVGEKQAKLVRSSAHAPVVPFWPDGNIYETAEDAFLSQFEIDSELNSYSHSSKNWWNAKVHEADTVPSQGAYVTDMVSGFSLTRGKGFCAIPLNAAAKRVVDWEEERDAILLRLLAKQMAASCIGNTMDPFLVIPKFATPELNSNQLVRSCNRAFVSKQTLNRWVPAMLAHPHILLSSTIMSSTWRDMLEGVCGESKRTMLLKAEIIGWINERLRNPDTMFHDHTIMVILHLLVGETWSCDERTLHIHMSGLARLIAARGNLDVPPIFDTVGLATAM